jgi:hypothetical protein|uniref:Capsule biosynthesis phosphatase n=1 Tax=Myoviridae sp. ctCo31 TaxID=2825053 RepID=A0A8S5ULX0_9CAUD|nr:MAG TPA: capsule biosynthesis phosphatase [Myoviridae sp. ctCo31]
MKTNKIIFDFDNTIGLHKTDDTSDISKCEPNISLIQTINKLYENGFYIKILTARGHLSCKSREQADKKYRPIIEKWLSDNNVLYNELSFNKDLALYYVDDLSLLPNDILQLEKLL